MQGPLKSICRSYLYPLWGSVTVSGWEVWTPQKSAQPWTIGRKNALFRSGVTWRSLWWKPAEPRIFEESPCTLSTRKKDMNDIEWSFFKKIIKTQFISIYTGWHEQMVKTPIVPMIPKCVCWQKRFAEDPGEQVSPKGMRPSMGDGGSWYQVHS